MPTLSIQKHVASISKKPGIYQFYDSTGKLLYIGKAKNLRNRVRSYFHDSSELTSAKHAMVENIGRIETIITKSETDALVLEATLIKKHQPPYNIELKDDKNFLYIKVTTNEEFPRVFTSRKVLPDKARYFGPYTSADSVRQTLRELRRLFPHRNFEEAPTRRHLEYLTRRYAQLFGPQERTRYLENIGNILLFLQGRYDPIINSLEKDMASASAKQLYERAARYRDSLRAIHKMKLRQKVLSIRKEDFDAIGLAREDDTSAVAVLFVREGKLTGKQDFLMKKSSGESDGNLLRIFMERYYLNAPEHVRRAYLPLRLNHAEALVKTTGMKIAVAHRGMKRELADLAHRNAREFLLRTQFHRRGIHLKVHHALKELADTLSLPSIPKRIECYDISNIQGKHPVGSMIVFTDGLPDKHAYRKFSIKTVRGSNDPAMMAEMLSRRFTESRHVDWPKPGLIILDGGKGQLSVATQTLGHRLAGIPICALAKREEELYIPANQGPLRLAGGSDGYHLLQRIRDEAHRFAIRFYRSRHSRATTSSILDEIPGVGPAMKKKLLRTFGSLQGIRESSVQKLTEAVGRQRAKKIREAL